MEIINTHLGHVGSACLTSSNGAVSSLKSSNVKLFDKLDVIHELEAQHQVVGLSLHGKSVLAGHANNTMSLINESNEQEYFLNHKFGSFPGKKRPTGHVNILEISPLNPDNFISCHHSVLALWNVECFECPSAQNTPVPKDWISALRWSPTERFLFSVGFGSGTLALFDQRKFSSKQVNTFLIGLEFNYRLINFMHCMESIFSFLAVNGAC